MTFRSGCSGFVVGFALTLRLSPQPFYFDFGRSLVWHAMVFLTFRCTGNFSASALETLVMAQQQQNFAPKPPLTDGEVRLLRLLLQRATRSRTGFGLGPLREDQGDFCPTPVTVDRSPLFSRRDFVNAGVPVPPVENDHFTDFILFLVVGLLILWGIALLPLSLADRQLCKETSEGHHPPIEGLLWSLRMPPKGSMTFGHSTSALVRRTLCLLKAVRGQLQL